MAIKTLRYAQDVHTITSNIGNQTYLIKYTHDHPKTNTERTATVMALSAGDARTVFELMTPNCRICDIKLIHLQQSNLR